MGMFEVIETGMQTIVVILGVLMAYQMLKRD